MTDKIILKKGRIRIKQGWCGYTIECRLSWWLPFWWDMGYTPYFEVAENHIAWIEENTL